MQNYNKTLWENNVTVIDADKLNNIENQMDALTRVQGQDAEQFIEVKNMISLKANASHSHEKYESEIAVLDQELRQLKAEISDTAKYFDEVRLDGLNLVFYSKGVEAQSIKLPSNLSPSARAMCGEFLAGELNCGENVSNYSLDIEAGTTWVDGQTPVNAENLNKIENKLVEIAKKIAWLEENGGGGGGISNNTPPTISSTFTRTSFSSDEEIEIPYFIIDNQGGDFKAIYTIADGKTGITISEETLPAVLGPNVWKIGRLEKGSYMFKIYIKDYQLFSEEKVFNVTVGSLEITSNFRDKDYGLNEKLVVNYDIESVSNDPITVERILDGISETVSANTGRNVWNLGSLNKGVHTISLKAYTDNSTSNVLTYIFAVTDSDSLYISSTLNSGDTWNVEDKLIVPYRVSLLGGSKFIAHYKINGVEQPTANCALGMNFWDLGYVSVGQYELEIYVTDAKETMTSNTLNLTLNVQATDFVPTLPVEDFLLCWFSAKGKSNSYSDREEWIDKSGNNVQAKLVDVNYSNNGWIDDGLRLNGDAYVEIDLKPFENGVSNYGLTLDVQYTFNNLGNDDARIFSCESPLVPYQGCAVKADTCRVYGTESINESPNNENNSIRATFVIDPANQRSLVYINGVICNTALLSNTDQFVHDSKIYLNCQKSKTGEIINLSDCTIYNVRVYDKALTYEEVVQNHIADMDYEAQKEAKRRNTFSSLGKLDMDGNFAGMDADNQVPLRVSFSPNDGPGIKFDYPEVLVDWQGNSSLQYAIKNYNLDLMDENNKSVKIQMKDDWPKADSYHIKVNMVDSSHSFNVGIAKLLPKIYTEKLPPMLEDPDNTKLRYGVDGFPITIFNNGEFYSLGTFNLKQHRDLFGLSKKNPNHFMYRAEENSAMGAAAFRDSSDYSIEQEWENRHPKIKPGTGGDHSAFRRLIDFVKDSTDEDFKNNIDQYFNLNYLLDYYIICYAFGGIDSLGKNMTVTTWDGNIWYLMFYDMDTFFGFDNKGELVWGPEVRCPEDYNTSGSLLWEKVTRVFQTEIRNRYATLRRGGLNLETVLETIEGEVISQIGETFYNRDNIEKYLGQGAAYLYMAKGNRIQHLRKWLTARFLYVDSMFGYLPDVENTIILRNTMSGLWKIRIKTYTPQQITIDFGGTGAVGQEPYLGRLTKLCNNKEWTEFTYFFDGVYQRDISITGAKYIMEIDGLDNCELLMLDVRYCEKLLHLSANKNPNLTSLNMSNCIRLQSLDVSNCTRLGSTTGTPLDVGNCYNLKRLDISNTSVPALTTTNCSYLNYVDVSNSLISSINYANLQSLKTVNISNCSRLSDIKIDSCQGITELNIGNNPALRNITIENCKSLKSLSINSVRDLEKLEILECANLETIKIRNAESLQYIDLSECTGLVTFDAQAIPLIDIVFGEIANLKTLDVSKNTNLRTLDFTGCRSTLEHFKITGSENLKTIKDINLLVSTADQINVFRGNDYIQSITGNITFADGITTARGMFSGCIDLEEVPNIEFNEVTNLATMFQDCVNLTRVPDWDTSKMKDMSYMFYNCTSLVNAPLFDTSKVTNFNYMFFNCTSLKAAPNYDLSSTTSTMGMFKQCSGITTVPKLNTSKIVNFGEMFMDCASIEYLPDLDTSSATSLYYFLDGCTNLKAMPILNTSKVINFSRAFSRCESLFSIPEINTSSAENMSYMFYGDTNITSIEDMDMSKATNISGMLESCINLVDVPNFNTANVVNFSSLFSGCSKLQQVPELDTSSATDISSMYWDCTSLSTIPPINTTNVTRMSELFYNCSSLIEVPEFITDNPDQSTTANVTEMRSLFNNCKLLTEVPELDTSNVIDFSEMFSNCTGLTRVPRLDVTNATLTNEMFNNCINLEEVPELITTDKTTPCSKVTIMYSMFRNCSSLPQIPNISTKSAENISSLFEGCSLISEVPNIDSSKALYVESLFRGCSLLESINDLDLSNATETIYAMFEGCRNLVTAPMLLNLNSSVTIMDSLFKNCTSLTTIPALNTKYIINMQDMFRNCLVLKNLPDFEGGTGKVTNMSGMFNGCSSLSTIPLLNTANVTSMANMFNGCSAITTIPKLETKNVTNMTNMLANCTGLKAVPEFNTSNVTLMSSAFSGCKLITTIPLLNTSKVINMSNLFRDCTSLVSIPLLNTNNVTNMQEMFRGCTSLTTLPDGFNTSNVTTTYCTFYGCSSLETLPTLDLSSITALSYSMLMFYDCSALTTCSFRGIRTSFDVSSLNSLTDIKFYDCYRNANITVNNNQMLDADAINDMFIALNTVEKGTIDISGNLGTIDCDVSIAEAKGWTVVISF